MRRRTATTASQYKALTDQEGTAADPAEPLPQRTQKQHERSRNTQREPLWGAGGRRSVLQEGAPLSSNEALCGFSVHQAVAALKRKADLAVKLKQSRALAGASKSRCPILQPFARS
jgi:hypothetical protein